MVELDRSHASPLGASQAGPLLIYNSAVATTKDKTKKQVPIFSLTRCKRCGICSHFCPVDAIGVEGDGTPYLADPEACTSCGLCSDMCPDWAVCLTEVGEDLAGTDTRRPGESEDHVPE